MKLGSKDFIFVGVQLLLFAAYVFDVDLWEFDLPRSFEVGFLITAMLGALVILLALIQLNTNLSPFPSPKTSAELVQSGLYKYVRHPIYSGILILLLSYGLYTASSYKLGITIILYVLFYFKSGYEEVRLQEVFTHYKSYKKTTGRFFPKMRTLL
jgi:protein-S-isoprenylcysteine O-methyltransferase Ste14